MPIALRLSPLLLMELASLLNDMARLTVQLFHVAPCKTEVAVPLLVMALVDGKRRLATGILLPARLP